MSENHRLFAPSTERITTTQRETSRNNWVRRTRESVHRALAAERVPLSAGALEDNLDLGFWSSIGFLDRRTVREISAALNWLVAQGYAEVVTDRDPYDPPGKLYALTLKGQENVPAK